MQEYDTALTYYNKGLVINKRLGNQEFLSLHHIYIGLIHMKKNRLFEAKSAFETSLNSYPSDGGKRMKVFIYSNLAVVHLVIGAERDSISSYHLKKSVDYAEKTYALAEEITFLRQMRKATEILYKAYEALEQYPKAVEYTKEYILLNDSMYKEQEQEAIAEIQTKYETEKKELEIDILNKANALKENQLSQSKSAQRRQSIYTIITIIGLIIAIFISLFVYRLYQQKRKGVEELSQKNEIISEQKEKNEILLKEIHHRVKNNLQVISSLLDLQSDNIEDEKALLAVEDGQSRVKAMALIHQKLYQNKDVGSISFRDYTDQLCKQIAAVYTSNKKVEVNIEAEEVLLDIDTAVPLGLILNELLSNAYKYAFKTIDKGILSIQLKEQNVGEYQLLVADNGAGLSQDFEWKKAKSLGLRLVRRLSKQLFGSASYTYENGAIFKINFKDTARRKEML